MASVNKVIIVGHLGKDPEVRSFPDGGQVANVSIATTDKWKDKQSGEIKESTEWHRVNFNGRLAEIAGQYLKKGSQVYVEGSLKTRKWTDKDGTEKYATEIKADSLQMLGAKPGSGGGDQGYGGGQSNGKTGIQTGRQGGGDQGNAGSDGGAYAAASGRSAPRTPARTPASAPQQMPGGAAGGFDDMDDIPFATSSMFYDMTTSKSRKMLRYDY